MEQHLYEKTVDMEQELYEKTVDMEQELYEKNCIVRWKHGWHLHPT